VIPIPPCPPSLYPPVACAGDTPIHIHPPTCLRRFTVSWHQPWLHPTHPRPSFLFLPSACQTPHPPPNHHLFLPGHRRRQPPGYFERGLLHLVSAGQPRHFPSFIAPLPPSAELSIYYLLPLCPSVRARSVLIAKPRRDRFLHLLLPPPPRLVVPVSAVRRPPLDLAALGSWYPPAE
jgi:hypothetical protein